MRHSTMLVVVSVALSVLLSAWQETRAQQLKIDTRRSKIEFVGTKPDGKHVGGFKKFSGTVVADKSPGKTKVKIVIDTASIFTDNNKLTAHLKSPDFFNIRKYPKAIFESVKVEPGKGKGSAVIHGELTMLGKKQVVVIQARASKAGDATVMSAEFTIDRTKFGMNYGPGRVDNKVKIMATLYLTS